MTCDLKRCNKPSCTDLILANKPQSFQHSFVIKTGLSLLWRRSLRNFSRKKWSIVRDYRCFENDSLRTDLFSELGKANMEENENGLNNLLNVCKRILDIHAPRKQGNQMSFLYKEVMIRTWPRNKFLKDRSKENEKKYSKQCNYCASLLRKSKSEHFGNFNETNINDNKTFWKTIKPLSDKITSTNKMTLIDKEEITVGDYNTAKVLSTFFSNIVSNLNIAKYLNCEPLANKISDLVLKCVVKYRNHPSILGVRRSMHQRSKTVVFLQKQIENKSWEKF